MIQKIFDIFNTTTYQLTPTIIATEGITAIKVANHEGRTKRRKSNDLKCHHLSYLLDKSNIKLHHRDGPTNPADEIANFTAPRNILQVH